MKGTRLVVPMVIALGSAAANAAAQSPAEAVADADVDTGRWRCRFCPYPSGFSGSMVLGSGYVSESSSKFGEYNDLDDKATFLHAEGEVRWYGEDNRRWELQMHDLGLGTRSLMLEGSKQGHYDVRLSYDELMQHRSNQAETPFRGPGGAFLALPTPFVRASTTDGMTFLDTSLHPVQIESERREARLDVSLDRWSRWSWTFGLSNEERDGVKVTGGSFLVSATQLLEPLEYETNEIDSGIRYDADTWQIGLDYHASLFSNENRSLTFDNPFSAVTPGSNAGRLALPPDNEFHQLSLSGYARLGGRVHISGDLALGRMTQDERFIPASANSVITSPALPTTSLDAEVGTLSANARLNYATPVRGLTLSLDYDGDLRDTDTPQATFTQVITDSFVSGEATNVPLGYERHRVEGRVNYRIGSGVRLIGGVDYEDYERDYVLNAETQQVVGWGEIRGRLSDFGELSVKIAHADRDGSDQAPEVANGSPQNPLMTWFDIADRTEERARAAFSFWPLDALSMTLSAEVVRSEYDSTVIGRVERRDQTYAVDVSTVLREDLTLFGYYAYQTYETEQQNSQSFSTPDWFADTDDAFDAVGVGGRMNVRDGLDLTLDLTYTDSSGKTHIDVGTIAPGFPDFSSSRFTAQVRGDYQVNDAVDLSLRLIYEDYDSEDWHVDFVEPDTVPRLLGLGRISPDHDVFVTVLSVRYRLQPGND